MLVCIFYESPVQAAGPDTRHAESGICPAVSKKGKKAVKPYLLPSDHEAKPLLDSLFIGKRPLANLQALQDAGFDRLKIQPRSHIIVASHPAIPHYLLKLYLDDENRIKQGKEHWYWFANRCKGARKIRIALKKCHSQYFEVPAKYIYPLPMDGNEPGLQRKHFILLVQDMQLTDKEENLKAWKTKITPAHLDELYFILKYAGGGSYRPDNICYTKKETFAFIDTEYPYIKDPHLSHLTKYLSSEMQAYWRKLLHADTVSKIIKTH